MTEATQPEDLAGSGSATTNGARPSAGMWWTQPKLALLILGANVIAFGSSVALMRSAEYRISLLIAAQAVLFVVYWRISRRLGENHLAGRTRAAFEKNIWKGRWRPSRDKWTHPPDLIPREDGGSFYQQVLDGSEEGRESLYQAMSAWEGARLLWTGTAANVAIALTASTAGLAFQGAAVTRDSIAALIGSAVALPACLLILPEAIIILLLRRSILRAGIVERAALLVPRSAADLGLVADDQDLPEGTGREILIIMTLAIGVPVLMVIGFAAGLGVLGLSLVVGLSTIATGVWALRAFMRMLVSGIPFLRFAGPPAVSVLLDLAHRQRAYLSVAAFLYTPMVVGIFAPGSGFLRGLVQPMPWVALGYIIAITFGDQLAGYAGFYSATRFEHFFKRSMAKVEAAAS